MRLEAKDVWFEYQRGVPVLNGVSFSLERGERTGIVAPSGFGKTTLCQILAGYLKPQKGEALLDGRQVHTLKGYHPVQMIWQHPEYAVNPRLKLRHILEEGGPVGFQVMDALGIQEDWLDRFPRELSGGELQRFCIARALGDPVRFLVADEITTMLDMVAQAQIWAFLLQEVKIRDLGMLLVTHNLALAEKVCDHIVEFM